MVKKIIYIIVLVLVIFGLYKFLSKPSNPDLNNAENPDLIFYFGDTCPHCKNVEEYIQNNNIDQKLKISSKEVYQDEVNREELFSKVSQYCPEIDPQNIGVPLLFDIENQKCIQGDQPIIDFLSQKAQ